MARGHNQLRRRVALPARDPAHTSDAGLLGGPDPGDRAPVNPDHARPQAVPPAEISEGTKNART